MRTAIAVVLLTVAGVQGVAALVEAASPFPSLDPARLGVNVRAGMSYCDVPDESLFGGSYGVDGGYQLLGDWGFTGSAFASHQSGASQFVGTVGLARLPSFYPDSDLRRMSFACLYDQYTDSRQDLYLSQFRFQTGYAAKSVPPAAPYTASPRAPLPDAHSTRTIFASRKWFGSVCRARRALSRPAPTTAARPL